MLCRTAPTSMRARKPIFSCAQCASPSGKTRLGLRGVQQCTHKPEGLGIGSSTAVGNAAAEGL